MKKILYLFAMMLGMVVFTNCEENEITPRVLEIDYVGLESGFQIGVDPNGSTTQEIRIATSKTMSVERTFNIAVDSDLTTADASAYSVPSSVTVPANSNIGIFNIEVNGPNVNASGDDILTIGFTSTEDNLFISKPITLNLKQVCQYNEVTATFTFDDYPEEAYWQLYNNTTDTFLEGDGYSGSDCYVDLTSSTKVFCLQNGEYRFVVGDCYGDGGTGFELSFGDSVLLSSNGVSGSGEVFVFSIP